MLRGLWRKPRPTPLGHRRTVDIDGNIFSFRMPEDFSRDLPAYDLVERIITPPCAGVCPNVHIGRRWWDIHENGLFAGALGTLMLNMEVKTLPLNDRPSLQGQPLNIQNRFHFLALLHQQLGRHYRPRHAMGTTHGDFLPLQEAPCGDEWLSHYYDCMLRDHVWTGFGVTQGDNTLIEGYALPIHTRAYLLITFTHAANDNITASALQQYSVPLTQRIRDTFTVEYSANNEMAEAVEGAWRSISPR